MPNAAVLSCFLLACACASSPLSWPGRRFLTQKRASQSGAVQEQAQAQGIAVASAQEAEDLMPLFRPRGNRTLAQGGNWMGADCATSFRLDNGTDPRLSDGEARLMWLFGDTFVGAFDASVPQRQRL